MARKYFGDNFKVEIDEDSGERRVVGYYNDKQKIYSREKPGDLADFDEALTLLVDRDPEKDQMLTGTGAGGSGAEGGGSGNKDKAASLKAQYDAARKAGNTTQAIAIKNRLAEQGIYV